MNDKKLPIGYYVKLVDQLLTERINAVQAEFDLTRVTWQILNFISEQVTAKKDKLVTLMLSLTDNQTIEQALQKFTQDGIIKPESENLISLTEKGKALFVDCSNKQYQFRQKSIQHISQEDYQTTISTLEQIIKNIQ